MMIKIVTCPKCRKKTLILTATNSAISKKCTECNFNDTMLLSDLKQKEL